MTRKTFKKMVLVFAIIGFVGLIASVIGLVLIGPVAGAWIGIVVGLAITTLFGYNYLRPPHYLRE